MSTHYFFDVFDLDETMIDSTHRKINLPGGGLDLAHWIENSTHEKVMRDSLLPLADLWKKSWVNKLRKVVICTSRVMGDADYMFLMDNGLYFDHCLSRPMGCQMIDADLKDIQLRIFVQNQGMSWKHFCKMATMYDDNQAVITRMVEIGIVCYDAIPLNVQWSRRATG